MTPPRWRCVIGAGVTGGILATLVQLAAWWLGGAAVAELLARDARLTAALLLGRAALAADDGAAAVWMAAALVHFALSVVYAVLLLPLLRSGGALAALARSLAFGAALYAVNLHGFTLLFPWFVPARGAATLLAHLAFGAGVLLGARGFCGSAGGWRAGAR